MESVDFDLIICGGGPVGQSVAGLLARRQLPAARIALVDMKSPEQAAADPRTIALSYGSRHILDELGAWDDIGRSATAIEQIHVSRRGHFGRTLLDRKDYQLPALGYVARYGEVNRALASAIAPLGLSLMRPAEAQQIGEEDEHVAVTLKDGRVLRAQLVIQAEGGVFGEQQHKTLQRDYQQLGIIAHVQADGVIAHRAFERFTDEGPLALLPQDDGYALVWCVRPATGEQLMALDDAGFLAALQRTFGERVGRFTRIRARHAFPLGLNARPGKSRRVVAIGNAAQTLHPVAGQGLNLGLRDARVLADVLAREISPQALQAFERQRGQDRSLTIRLTDLMARIFAGSPQGSPLQAALGLSLGAIDLLPGARGLLAEHMMFGRR
ncbi:2-octaprenyl-6-methoxyphenyl hydroxylase [Herbaspirillum seropedicae]|uniref:FAD-dependent monooxygenase n=1 Tax=Herbaspirillum seropedicae TaxID=964 RepID=UPI00112131F0|nr:FAD-dependent monooxygenase [Herbaspirillum seropedicae]QDD63326.1 2-octaprenyl-6-methoxyphenyl hydroxylase [Herbaspirillum seropedicae]